MRIHIFGSIHDRGRFAKFDTYEDNFPSMIGQRVSLPVPDTAIMVQTIDEEKASFRFIRFDRYDDVTLRRGEQPYSYKHEGNAYGYEVTFELVE